jgi:hypothetical protein
MDLVEIDEAYRSLPLDHVVFMAQLLRTFAPGVLGMLGIVFSSDAELEETSAVAAPFACYALSVVAPHVDDELRAALTKVDFPAELLLRQR